jgi:hypothetical protein
VGELIVRHNPCAVKQPLTFVVLLLMTACSQQAERHPKYAVGSWTNLDGFDLVLRIDGSFQSGWKSPTKECRFEGTWFVSSGVLVSTITNVITSNIGTIKLASIGSIERCTIIPVEAGHLALRYEASSNYFRTNLFMRKL